MRQFHIGSRWILCLAAVGILSMAAPGCTADNFASGWDGSGPPPGSDSWNPTDGYVFPDVGGGGPCKKGGDLDKDGIPDDIEGCGPNQKDTDGDKFPDYNDSDSDGDKIPDKIEAGDPKAPRDSDGDKIPDYKDKDSDGDGVEDGDEDLNGDGKLGCCLTTCGEKRTGCPDFGAGKCGKGQKCGAGNKCAPLVHFLCSNGESDPKKKVTFPDSKTNDKDLPTFICHKAGETTGSSGLKPMQFKKNTLGGWHLALEKKALYGDLTLKNPKAKEAGAGIELAQDDSGKAANVAGFIVSIPATGTDILTIVSQLVQKISGQLPGKSKVSQVLSGTKITSHDGFPTVVSTQLAITLAGGSNPPTVRNNLFQVLLSRAGNTIANAPKPNFGPVTAEHVLVFQTQLRAKEGRLLIMGAVAAKSDVSDVTKMTSIFQDDLSNGTGLATLTDGDTVECDPFYLAGTPTADIIWIIDESGSMDDDRQNIINNATDFFARAVKSGLDFRMAVAGMKNPSSSSVIEGKFCSVASSSTSHDGGPDHFLLKSEQATFKACIKNPPYYEGGSEYGLAHTYQSVVRHLPRKASSANDKTKIRSEATLVVIIVTDEAPQEFKSYTTYKGKPGFLSYSDYSIDQCTSGKMSQINSYLQDWYTLLQGKHPQWKMQAKATVHLIAGVCKSKCGYYSGPEYPWGYQELSKATGGQIADICQKNLGATLQKIIDSVAGNSSSAKLQYIPMSASLAVAINKKKLNRSRSSGFDYSRASNTLVFLGVAFNKGDMVVASYRRWTKQQQVN